MTQILEKAIINKLKKSTYDTKVESGAITPQMIKEEAWLFTDDQFVSESDVTNWNNKANLSDVPTKTSELINDSNFLTQADIPTRTSELINDSNFVTQSEVPTRTSELINDSNFATQSEIPTSTSELINDSGFITQADIPTSTSQLINDSGFITNTVNNLTNYTLKTSTGSQITVTIDPTTFVMTLALLDLNGSQIDSASVDLPLESMVVGATYDSMNKAIVLTLQSGETISVPVADLVDGLQEEITVNNKLASDLVDDTNQTNKFVTTSEKSTWNAKYDKPGTGIPKSDLASTVQASLDKADTALQSFTETDPVFTASPAYGITLQDITDWNNKSDFSGNYADLTNKPTALSDFTNDENFISDANYVHTDNNYTTADKNKLSGIESGAEVNTIETIKVNGTALTPDQDRAVDITVAGSAANISYDNTTSGLTADDVQEAIDELVVDLGNKVDKVTGKQLSTEDFTTAEKTKLAGIETGAEVNDIDTIKVNGVTQTITNKYVDISVPTTTSELTNTSGFIDKDVNDLTNYTKTSDLPAVNDATLTIQKNSTSVGTFTANASTNKIINISVPTAMSDLTNDNNTVTDANYVHTDNNFTNSDKTKLTGIETGAEVNDIDTIKVNGTTQTITNKTVDITIPSADEYTLEEVTATAGYAKSYQLKKNSTYIGDKIDIPSDLVVESGEVKTVTTPDVPYQGAVPGDKYIDLTLNDPNEDHIYIPVNDLVDAYTAGNGIAISNANVVSVELDNNNTNGLSVSSNGLALSTATTSTSGAMSSTDKTKLEGIEAGAQVNVIESVVVNGTTATVSNKTASVTIQTGAIDTISVNGVTQPIDINKNVDITVPTTADEISYRIGYSDTWYSKTWTGYTGFNGNYIWTDGKDTYYSNGATQYVLNKSTSTWTAKTWNGYRYPSAPNIWTDGEHIYSSINNAQYILDVATSTWTRVTWNIYPSGQYIWTDGENIYYSYNNSQYVLDKSTSTWLAKTWTGLTSFVGSQVWTDGENIYYSNWGEQYVLDKSTSTWSAKTWSGATSFYGNYIWTDGKNVYLSNSGSQYVLDKSTSTWNTKTWTGLTSFYGNYIWTDGKNIYYSSSTNQYVLDLEETTVQEAIDDLKTNTGSGGDSVPIGLISPYPASTPPHGWLLCDGSAVSRTTYKELFDVIGTTHGSGDGSTTFNLPDMPGYIPIGVDANDSHFNAAGKKYGEKTHTLTIGEMPSHNHDFPRLPLSYNGVDGDVNGLAGGGLWAQGISLLHNTQNTGGGQPHNNTQPSIAEYYMIKAFKVSVPGNDLGDTLPIGSVIDYDGDTVPDGYVEISGTPLSYEVLYDNSSGTRTTTINNHTMSEFLFIQIFCDIGVLTVFKNGDWSMTSSVYADVFYESYFRVGVSTVNNTNMKVNVTHSGSVYQNTNHPNTTDKFYKVIGYK